MLATILFILKIIGIVLLAILSLALFMILIILFVPVRYTGYGKKEGDEGSKIRAGAGASWLLKIVSADYEYSENSRGLTIRVFGIRLRSREEKEEKRRLREEKRELKKKDKKAPKKKSGSRKTKIEYTMTEYDASQDVFKENTIDPKGDPKSDDTDKKPSAADTGPYGQELFIKLKDKILRIYDKISNVVKGLFDKAEEVDYYIDALSNDASNRQAVALIIKKVKALLKSIRPKKLKGYVDYGGDDPADTGRMLAAAAIAYPLYSPGLKINPDFESNILAFDVYLKGRIYIYVLVRTFIALYFNKKVKRLIRIMKKENDNGR
ncbi:MAG: DUF2953 domain-containing protein [Lachnospiraceae bacterium]|nr:DUF2953 domain-containing protein [Lachnospiraceae bacterium]